MELTLAYLRKSTWLLVRLFPNTTQCSTRHKAEPHWLQLILILHYFTWNCGENPVQLVGSLCCAPTWSWGNSFHHHTFSPSLLGAQWSPKPVDGAPKYLPSPSISQEPKSAAVLSWSPAGLWTALTAASPDPSGLFSSLEPERSFKTQSTFICFTRLPYPREKLQKCHKMSSHNNTYPQHVGCPH